VSAQHARRERPRDPQLPRVRGRDLRELAVARVRIIAARHVPLALRRRPWEGDTGSGDNGDARGGRITLGRLSALAGARDDQDGCCARDCGLRSADEKRSEGVSPQSAVRSPMFGPHLRSGTR
jgi:hypothetical protein